MQRQQRAGSPLGALLVAPQRQLAPFRPRERTVAMPTALPQQLRYGSVPPGIAQNQRFTGGVVQHQPGVNFNAPPDFVGPTYPTPGGASGPSVHPVVAALSALLGVGGRGVSGPSNSGSPLGGVSAGAILGSRTGAAPPPASLPGSNALGNYSGGYAPLPYSSPAPAAATGSNALGSYTGGFTPYNDLAARLATGRRGIQQI